MFLFAGVNIFAWLAFDCIIYLGDPIQHVIGFIFIRFF